MIGTVGTGCRGRFLEERKISALSAGFTNDLTRGYLILTGPKW